MKYNKYFIFGTVLEYFLTELKIESHEKDKKYRIDNRVDNPDQFK